MVRLQVAEVGEEEVGLPSPRLSEAPRIGGVGAGADEAVFDQAATCRHGFGEKVESPDCVSGFEKVATESLT